MRDHGRLLKNFFLHIMAVIALFDRGGGHARSRDFAFDRIIVLVKNLRAFAGDDDPVAFFQIGNLLRQWRKRQRVRTQIGFAIAIAHDKGLPSRAPIRKSGNSRKAIASAKAPRKTGEHSLHRLGGRIAGLHLFAHQMRDNLCISVAFKTAATRGHFVAQRFEILDNAIVDQSDLAGRMRMRVARRRRTVRGPAGMRDADIATGEVDLRAHLPG